MASFPVTETNLISHLPWSKDFVQAAGMALSSEVLKLGKHNVRSGTTLRSRLRYFMRNWETKDRLFGGYSDVRMRHGRIVRGALVAQGASPQYDA